MRVTKLVVVGLLLIGGCAQSDQEDAAKPASDPPSSNDTAAVDQNAAQPNAEQAPAETAEENNTNDAEILLASTLEKAKAADKRVMVHLGAPW